MRVGYTGGTTAKPTYQNIGDHTEAFQVDFDPKVTSFEKLLEAYWSSGPQCGAPFSRQYRHAIWYHDDTQRRLAEKSRDAVAKKTGRAVTTAIEAAVPFTLAEDYHQKYYLRSTPLWKEYTAIYPKMSDLLRSTAVTRANAWVSGQTKKSDLADLPKMGLSDAGRKWLLKRAR